MKIYCIAVEPIVEEATVGGSDWYHSKGMRDNFLKSSRHRYGKTHRFTPFTLDVSPFSSIDDIVYEVDTAAWNKTYVPDKEEDQ